MGLSAQLVKRHVNKLAGGQIFTTRDLLAYGPRQIIDNMTSRLVKKGAIRRLAYGVFMKPHRDNYEPTALEIAKAKMRAWGKNFWHDPEHTTARDSQGQAPTKHLVLFVSGSSSRLKTNNGVEVVLQHIGQRKMKLSGTAAGQIARRVWNAGKDELKSFHIEHDYVRFGREAISEFLLSFRLIPAWLNDWVFKRRRRHFAKEFFDIGFLTPKSAAATSY